MGAGQALGSAKAALYGSSHYDLPAPLRWFTANIGIHNVHHLCSRIPYYRLSRVLQDKVSHVTLGSFRYVRLEMRDLAA